MLRCTGKVVRFESKPWSMNRDGQMASGITHTARVIVGDADFVDVKIPSDSNGMTPVPFPTKGDQVDYAVVPGVSGGKVSVNVRGTWEAVVGVEVKPLSKVG
jgi:hypothetical protein